MVDQWPAQIRHKLIRGRYQVLWSNAVFSVVKTILIPRRVATPEGSPAEDLRSLQAIISTLSINPPGNGSAARDASPTGPSLHQQRYDMDGLVRRLVDVAGWESQASPNTSATGEMLRDIQLIKANIKTLAWRIEMLEAPPSLEWLSLQDAITTNGRSVEPTCRLCTSTDIYSSWHRQLAATLRSKNFKLRKIWEWTSTIQAMSDCGYLNSSAAGLRFGCGTEPLASCFANFVGDLLITDAPPHIIEGKGWSDTNQHTASL